MFETTRDSTKTTTCSTRYPSNLSFPGCRESSEQPGVSAQTKGDPAATLLPLVHQEPGVDGKPKTTILEQPLDFTTLADKYNDYVTVSSRTKPFLL